MQTQPYEVSRPSPAGQALQVLTLGLDHEVFALETELVHEVLDLIPITEVPNARPFVRGLVNVRGKVVPVLDLKCKFGMGQTERTPESRIVVMEVVLRGEPAMIGVLADRVHEVVELPAASLEDAPSIGMRWRQDFIRAVGKRDDGFVIVMDVARVFAAEDASVLAARPELVRAN